MKSPRNIFSENGIPRSVMDTNVKQKHFYTVYCTYYNTSQKITAVGKGKHVNTSVKILDKNKTSYMLTIFR